MNFLQSPQILPTKRVVVSNIPDTSYPLVAMMMMMMMMMMMNNDE